MVQLHRAGLTPGTVHGDEIGDPFLDVEDDLAVLAIPAAVVIACDLLERVPPTARAHLVNGHHGVEIAVFGGQLGGAFLRGGEGCPCGGAAGVAGVVRLARILGRAGGGIDRRATERELARLLLDVPQLGNQARQQVRSAEDNIDFLASRVASGRPGRQERAQVQFGVHFRFRGVLFKLNQQLGSVAHDALRPGSHLYGVHPGVRQSHLVEHQPLGRLASQRLIVLVPSVGNVAGFNLQSDDKLRCQPHHTGRWQGLNGDHRQHGCGHPQLPIQHHVPCRPVETVHRHAVHLTLDGVEPNLARQVTAQVGVRGSNLQRLNRLAGVNGQRGVKITALSIEGGDATARRTPLHPHGSRCGTVSVGRLIRFRCGPGTGSAIFPACFARLNGLKECVRQLDRIRQHSEIHGVAVKGTAFAADVEAVTPRVLDGHTGQNQCLVGCAGNVDPVFQPLVVKRPVP